MQDLIIPSNVPSSLVVLRHEVMEEIVSLTTQAHSIASVCDDASMAAADAIVSAANKLDKLIEAERTKAKAPIIALGKAIDEAAGEARTSLTGIKLDLGKAILAYQRAENDRRAAERARLEAGRQAAIKAREAAIAERVQVTAEAAPWEEPAAPAPLPVIPVQEAPPVLKSSSVVEKVLKRVEIYDADAVPREVAGVRLWKLDEMAVNKLMKAGVPIPGVRIVEVSTLAAKG